MYWDNFTYSLSNYFLLLSKIILPNVRLMKHLIFSEGLVWFSDFGWDRMAEKNTDKHNFHYMHPTHEVPNFSLPTQEILLYNLFLCFCIVNLAWIFLLCLLTLSFDCCRQAVSFLYLHTTSQWLKQYISFFL